MRGMSMLAIRVSAAAMICALAAVPPFSSLCKAACSGSGHHSGMTHAEGHEHHYAPSGVGELARSIQPITANCHHDVQLAVAPSRSLLIDASTSAALPIAAVSPPSGPRPSIATSCSYSAAGPPGTTRPLQTVLRI